MIGTTLNNKKAVSPRTMPNIPNTSFTTKRPISARPPVVATLVTAFTARLLSRVFCPQYAGLPVKDSRGLLRVLGIAFGWAVTLGGMISAGILRAPGEAAQATTSAVVFLGLWVAGALYATLGALSL